MIRTILVAAAGLALVIPALAESMQMDKPMGDQGASSHAFAEANAKMHKDMMFQYSGNADADFVRLMAPHHQGASDLAEVELKYGKDPELRKIAEKIIKMQGKEISEFKSWSKTHTK